MKVLFVSRERHRLPLDEVQRRKWDALAARMELRVLAAAASGSPTEDERFRLAAPLRPRALDGIGFYAALPFRAARELRAFRPDAVLVQGVHEAGLVLAARRLAGSRARLVLDVQGDLRAVTRYYGSPLRRLATPLADAFAPLAVRHADAVRAVSSRAAADVRALGVEPAVVLAPYVDLGVFSERPPVQLPVEPRAVFVGVLERVKAFDTLAAAWRLAVPRLPNATLQLVGVGTLAPLADALVRDLPQQTEWARRLEPDQVAAAMDAATVVLLPSRSEGLPRVAVEALARGRPVIGGARGGIPDVVQDGVNGLLVDPEDPAALAAAIVRVLGDRELAERLATGARETAPRWTISAETYADALADVLRTAIH